MTCAEARAALLDTELDALRPGRSGVLGAHLEACAGCRAAADRILAGTAALAADRGRHPRRPSVAVAEAARAAGRPRRLRRRRLRLLVPVLAAAALTVFFVRDIRQESGGFPPRAPASLDLPPLVEGGGQNVAVFSTTRPDIKVVWQF